MMSQDFRRTYIWTLTALLFLLPASQAEVPQAVQAPCISRVAGDIRNGAGEAIAQGTPLIDGDVITAGRNSWCEVKWSNAIVRAWQETSFQIQPSRNIIAVRQGSLRLFAKRGDADNECYELRTPHYRAQVSGSAVTVTVSHAVEQISSLQERIVVYDLKTNAIVRAVEPGNASSSAH